MNSLDSVTAQRTIPISILLSVYNGAAFRAELLQSLQHQTHADGMLIWRDDGSTDQTRQIMRHFSESLESGRCLEVTQGGDHLGIARSFGLLLDHVPDQHRVAFCDQDDIWSPGKLECALKAMRRGPNAFMSTFCANARRLLGCTTVLREQNRVWLADLQRALDMKGLKGGAARYRLSRRLGQMRRNAFMEQQVFRLWFIFG